ncbi:WxL domain-containing protein [Listeria ilorinensis]|uniref:WxL domain-containing protein n=1 Tax=Listeria ilorinensis TaxID=2867439 RepID=UPI001EF5FBBE|nr:WxL domain-containing protein [Listeria ilorinensis]
MKKGKVGIIFLVSASLFIILTCQINKLHAKAAISLGNSQLNATVSSGTYNQSIVNVSYRYAPLASLTLNDTPVVIIQLPAEIGDQLAGNTTKQAAFLSKLTGEVTYPVSTILNRTESLVTTNAVMKRYDAANRALIFTFPQSTSLLLITNYWQVSFAFDVGELYKSGIRIPAPYNNQNYAVKGTFVSVTDGINLTTGNAKSATLEVNPLVIGSYPVLSIAAPVLTDNLLHSGTVITGSANQVLDSSYTYTADIIYQTRSGVVTRKNNLPVQANGSFQTTLDAPYEYGDSAKAVLHATSKTNSDTYDSPESSTVTVKWPLPAPLWTITAKPGDTSISGSFSPVVPGNYHAYLTVGQTNYDVTLASGQTSFSQTIPVLTGGEKLKAVMQAYSTRTGELLLTSAAVEQTVPYQEPQLALTQSFEKKTADGSFVLANAAVSGQTIRLTATAELSNQYASWDKENLQLIVPKGLINLQNLSLVRIKTDGTRETLATPVIQADSSVPSGQKIIASITGTPLQTKGEKLQLQYSGDVITTDYPSLLSSVFSASGVYGGNQTAFAPVSSTTTLAVSDGSLRIISVPNAFSFGSLRIPTKENIYQPTATAQIQIADGRVTKSPWQLYLKQTAPLSNGRKSLPNSLYYEKNSQKQLISNENQLVATHLETTDTPYTIQLNQSEGLRLKVAPGPAVEVGQSYQGQLMWTLTDAP